VVFLEKVKEKVEALVEFWSLWWFPWRWRRKKMKVRSWRSCGGGWVEKMVMEELEEVGGDGLFGVSWWRRG